VRRSGNDVDREVQAFKLVPEVAENVTVSISSAGIYRGQQYKFRSASLSFWLQPENNRGSVRSRIFLCPADSIYHPHPLDVIAHDIE